VRRRLAPPPSPSSCGESSARRDLEAAAPTVLNRDNRSCLAERTGSDLVNEKERREMVADGSWDNGRLENSSRARQLLGQTLYRAHCRVRYTVPLRGGEPSPSWEATWPRT